MSFARKIKTWGLATPATFATDDRQMAENLRTVATLATLARSIISKSDDPGQRTVATVATVAMGQTFKSEVIEVHNLKLRHRLEVNGLAPDDALALAIKLYGRRADFDDRRICHECYHFTRKLCTNAKAAELSIRLKVMAVPTGSAEMLQRCLGFAEADL